LFFDPYDRNRATGGFVLIDPNDFRTIGAGMIRHSSRSTINEIKRESRELGMQPFPPTEAIQWTPGLVALADRTAAQRHQPLCVWLYGGDSRMRGEIAVQLEKRLFNGGIQAVRMTDENTRDTLNADLRTTAPDIQEASRRHVHLARLLNDFGLVVICAFEHAAAGLDTARQRFAPGGMLAVSLEANPAQPDDCAVNAASADPSACAATLAETVNARIRA